MSPTPVTMTLGEIRRNSPCRSGWEKLLRYCGYSDGQYIDYDRVSLGDVAVSNDIYDALWCLSVLDFSDLDIRRAVLLGAVFPSVLRAAEKAGLSQEIFMIERWCRGDTVVPIDAVVKSAGRVALAAEMSGDRGADYASRAVLRLAQACRVIDADAGDAVSRVQRALSYASAAVAQYTGAANLAEREAQRADIIAAFPPIHGAP